MSPLGPDRHLYSSRRSKKLSLDGTVPGIEYVRRRGGQHYAGMRQDADLSGRVLSTPSPHRREEYDPIRSEYPTAPGYGPPDPWDGIALEPFHHPPSGPLPREPFVPRPPTYRQSAALGEAMGELMEEVLSLRQAGDPVPEPFARLFDFDSALPGASMNDAGAGEPSVTDLREAVSAMGTDLPLDSKSAALAEITLSIDEARHPAGLSRTENEPLLAQQLCVNPVEENDVQLGPQEPVEPMRIEALAPLSSDMPPIGADDSVSTSEPDMSLEEMADQFAPEDSIHAMEVTFNQGLEGVVNQFDDQFEQPTPEEPDPMQLLDQMFDQQIQMMDPFRTRGPMG